MSDTKATVLFVCVHNAGRSQMAAGYLQALAGDRIQVLSAGTQPKDQVNPSAIEAMAEEGIDIANNVPKVLSDETVKDSDYVITMGCGDACPWMPANRFVDWQIPDPKHMEPAEFNKVRDFIRDKIAALLSELEN